MRRFSRYVGIEAGFPAMTAAALLLTGCSLPPSGAIRSTGNHLEVASSQSDHERAAILTHELLGLGSDISPEEANRLAVTAITTARALAVQYQAVRPAWLHNMKVNSGFRERGLCYQWAEDLYAALEREQFRTLQLHRTVARFNTPGEHSGVVIAATGADFKTGLVLDAWRWSGRLAWSPVLKDKYPWKPFFPGMLVDPSAPLRVE